MAETKCPICNKDLVRGECLDCGYKVDNYVLPNQRQEYYTEDYGQSSKNTQGAPQNPNYNPQNQASNNEIPHYPYNQGYQQNQYNTNTNSNDKTLMIIALIAAVIFPIIGLILGSILLKNTEPSKRLAGKIAVILAGSIIFLNIMFAVIGIIS